MGKEKFLQGITMTDLAGIVSNQKRAHSRDRRKKTGKGDAPQLVTIKVVMGKTLENAGQDHCYIIRQERGKAVEDPAKGGGSERFR